MSRVTDERVVEMRFDNQNFEKNVQTSLHTIDTLKKSLNFDESSKSLQSLEDQTKKVSFAPLADAVDAVKVKFSALETVAIGALLNITNKAVDAGTELVKSLSVDNVMSGWQKYEEITRAVGTLVSQGFGLDEVTTYMDQLNWFTDETSYNLTDMVKTIGAFTASGKSLNDSVEAMEGIANWAALSGQNAQVASAMMSQLSKAISKYFQARDWDTLATHGMDNVEFRIRALQAGVEEGTISLVNGSNEAFLSTLKQLRAEGKAASEIKEYVDTLTFHSNVGTGEKTDIDFGYSNIRDSLASGRWLNPAVQMNVYRQYGAAIADIYDYATEKGITASQAIEELNGKVDDFGLKAFLAAQEARTWSDTVDSVKDAVSTGWMKTFEYIFGNYEEAKRLWTDLANSMWEVFAGPVSERNEMLAEWKELGGRDDIIDAFWNIFGEYDELENRYTGLVGLIQMVKEAFQEIFPPKTAAEFKKITEKIKEWTERFKFTDDQVKKLKDTFKGIFSVFSILKQIIQASLKPFTIFKNTTGSFLDIILSITGWIGNLITKFAKWLEDSQILTNVIQGIINLIKKVPEYAEKALKRLTGMGFAEFGEKIKSGFESFVGFLKTIPSAVKNAFKGITSKEVSDKVTGMLDDTRTGFQKFFDWLKGAISSVASFFGSIPQKLNDISVAISGLTIGQVFDKVKESITSFFEKVREVFSKLPKIDMSGATTFSEKVQRIFEPVRKVFEGIKNFITWVWDGIKSIISKIAGVLKKVFGDVGNGLKQIDWEKALKIAKTIFEMGLIKKLMDLTKSLQGLVDSLAGIGKSFQNALNSITEGFKKAQKELKSTVIRNIALSILMIAGAIAILALIPEKQLKSALEAFGAVVGALAAFMTTFAVLSKFSKDTGKLKFSSDSITSLSKSLVYMAAAMLVVALALKTVAKLDADKAGAAVGMLTGIMVVFVAFAKLAPKSRVLIETSKALLVVSTALYVSALAIRKLAGLDQASVAISGGVLGGMLMLFMLFAKVAPKSKVLIKTAEAIVVLAAGLYIVAKAIKIIAKLDQASVAISGGILGGMLMLFMLFAQKAPKSKDLIGTASAMVIMAAALVVVSLAIRSLAKLEFGQMMQGVLGIALAMAVLVIALKAIDTKSVAGAAGILMIAGALLLLVPVLLTLGKMPWDEFGKSLLGLAAIMTIFVVAGYALSPVVIILLAFGAAMALLGLASIELGIGLGLLAVSLGPFSIVFAAFAEQLVEGIIVLIKAIPRFISALVVGLMESAGDIIKGLGVLLDILLEFLKDAIPKIATFLVEITMQIIHLTLSIIGQHMYEIVTDVIFIFSEFIKALSDAFSKLSWQDVGNIILTLVEAMGLLALLIPVMAEAAIVTSMLAIIGANLSLFAVSIIPFLAVLSAVDENTIKTAGMLADVVLKMTTASILDAITSWFTGGVDFEKFAEQFETLGDGIARFANKVKGIDAAQTEAAASAAYILTVVANNLPRTGGVLQELVGTQSLSAFAKELEDMGPSIENFSKHARNVNGEAVSGAANAAQAMINVANNLPRQGGLWQKIAGSKDLSKFAAELNDMGPSIAEFSKQAKKVNSEAVIGASNAAQAMVNVANNLPKQGGLWQKIAGSKDLSKFAQELNDMGPSIVRFSRQAKQVNGDAVIGASNAAQAILNVANNLPKQGGFWQSIAGTKSLSLFADELADFGPHYVEFSKSVAGAVSFNYNQVANATLKMVEVANELPIANEGFLSWFLSTRKLSLSDFAQEMEWAGPHFAAFASSISGITVDGDAMTTIVGAITEMIKVSNDLPTANNGFLSWFLSTRQLSLSQFADEMKVAAPKFKDFCGAISGITLQEGDQEKSEYLMSILTAMIDASKNMPKASLGLIGLITGNDMSLSKFGKELAAFGPDYATFINSFSDMTMDTASVAYKAVAPIRFIGQFLTALSGFNVNNWAELAASLLGQDTSLSDFGKELEKFGPHYRAFLDSFTGYTSDEAEKIKTVLSTMGSVAELLTVLDGWRRKDFWELIFGEDKPLSFIGSELETFGENLNSFLSAVRYSSTTTESIQPVITLLGALTTFVPSIPSNLDPLHETLHEFGADLDLFGNDLKAFMDIFLKNDFWINGNTHTLVLMVMDDVDRLITMAETISNTMQGLTSIDSENVKTMTNHFTSFLSSMQSMIKLLDDPDFGVTNDQIERFEQFVQKLVDIANETAEVNTDTVTSVFETLTGIPASSIKKMTEEVMAAPAQMTEAVNNLMDACTDAIKAKGPEAKTAFSNFMMYFKNFLTDPGKRIQLMMVGKSIMTLIQEGLTEGQTQLDEKIKSIINSLGTTAKKHVETKEVQDDLRKTGQEIINGIVKGLEDKKDILKKKSEDLAKDVIDPFSSTMEIQSPSKVMIRLGKFVAEGLVIGMQSYAPQVEDVSEELGTEAERGLSLAMQRVRDIILADPDDTITIRPVLDLSEIQNGTEQMRSMMNGVNSPMLYGSYSMASDIANRVRSKENGYASEFQDESIPTKKEDTGPSTTFNNTFNIQGEDPQAIATEVSRIIQRQTERKEAVWGS